ncbi:Transcriptional activator, variant 2 [Metarhizium acridum]|nr:Transcriptional activator, variant 2 [Metarhizium acridum]
MGNSSSTYLANRLNPTTETLAWHMHPHYDDISWLRRPVISDMCQLPPRDFAKRLFLAQHAYIGTIFSFLTADSFCTRVERIYASPPDLNDRDDCLTFCQILLVFAFGQMYSVNQWTGNEGPPGFQFFKCALQFLPDIHEDGSVLFIEVLSYVAYYMQTLNRRDSAYLYAGLALRMAVSLGLHQEVMGQDMDSNQRERRRRVWWSVYSLERLLCVTSGNPISINDSDINALFPSAMDGEDPQCSVVLRGYTELSRILGRIGQDIYRKKPHSGTTLMASIQGIMNSLTDWHHQLPADMRLDQADLDKPIKREMASIHLHYYHCINMTARPLLLYAVQRQMAANSTDGERMNMSRWEDDLPPDIVRVIETSIAAARSSISILNAAATYNLVGPITTATYGFIDGEQAFSAALLLVMVNMAFPYRQENATAMDTALHVLHSMAEKGNKYICACHALLTKIRATIKPTTSMEEATTADTGSQETLTLPGSQQPDGVSPSLDNSEDPSVWTEVLESLGIDMDRQWIGSFSLT